MADQAPTIPKREDPDISFEKQHVEKDTFLRVLDEAVAALDSKGVDYIVIGGVASAICGRPRYTLDIDLFVRPVDASAVLQALETAGFETKETDPSWLYKGMKDGVVIDVLFQSSGNVLLDDEMAARTEMHEFMGRRLRMAAPEDLLVMKALAHSEDVPRYWHDALAIVGRAELDWEYVLRRACRHGARRVLSLLIYAESIDLVVPSWVVRRLFETIYGEREETRHRAATGA